MSSESIAESLEKLAGRIADEAERTEAHGRAWLPAPTMPDAADTPYYNVVICGAGMSGLATAFGLKRRGVEGVLVIDRSPKGREGPWVSCARMKTLRSPKCLAGPDFGIPSLTPRSWFEAVHGAEAWEGLGRISRADWMAYLNWYREITAPNVENGVSLVGISHLDGWLELELEDAEGRRRIRCRRLVLATGIDGGGGPRIPDFVRGLPKHLWTHSAEVADDSHLRDRDVAVLGSATSSFDWAVTALELGARHVTMIGRGAEFGRTEVLAWTNFPGFLGHYGALPDIDRWRFAKLYHGFKIPPTQDQFDRALAYSNFDMRLGHDIRSVTEEAGRVRIETGTDVFVADHLLLGTGYALGFALRPELAALAPVTALWADRFVPPAGEESAMLAAHPYLGPGFELMPKNLATDSWVSRIHMFNGAALPSLGPISNGVTGMKFGLSRIIEAVVGSLFVEASGDLMRDLAAFREHHFDPRGYDEAIPGKEEVR